MASVTASLTLPLSERHVPKPSHGMLETGSRLLMLRLLAEAIGMRRLLRLRLIRALTTVCCNSRNTNSAVRRRPRICVCFACGCVRNPLGYMAPLRTFPGCSDLWWCPSPLVRRSSLKQISTDVVVGCCSAAAAVGYYGEMCIFGKSNDSRPAQVMSPSEFDHRHPIS